MSKSTAIGAGAIIVAVVAIISLRFWFEHSRSQAVTLTQTSTPPGYYDIPSGFDFPADKQRLEGFIATSNVSGERIHVWNVFAGMTQSTPDGKYPIFETWYTEDETFLNGPTLNSQAARRVTIRFRQPDQFRNAKGLQPLVAGSALLSFVLYNQAAYTHIRANQLYKTSKLDVLRTTGTQDPNIPGDRTIPAFPADAVSIKTVWWPVAKDKATAMPIWDPENNPPNPRGNDFTTWPRVVVVDPSKRHVPPNSVADITFMGKEFPNSHVVGLDSFYYIVLDQKTAADAMNDPAIARAAQIALGRSLQAGDFTVFAGTHLTTKEIDNWVWATFWWHDRPNDGPFAADRPDSVKGVWRNYLMNTSFDLNLPEEKDGSPHVTFNPWLEARFKDGGNGSGVVSNCMNCHNRSSYPGNPNVVDFLPIYRGNPDIAHDPQYAPGRLRTDFLWSIPDQAQ